jgi:arylformamidase
VISPAQHLAERRGPTEARAAVREDQMVSQVPHFAATFAIALGVALLCACASSSPAEKEKPWKTMDRATLDASYNNSKAVPEGAAMFKEWQARSAQVRSQHADHLDLAYGPRPRNRIDYFSAGSNTPVLVFIHGGFWQMRSKDDFAFLAESFLDSGISVAMVGYPLGPDATMDEIVADTHAAIRYLASHLADLGGDSQHVVVSGWSSGGHLATMVLDEASLRGGVSISGLYELEPLVGSYVNDKLHMDAAMARRSSPILSLPKTSKPLDLFAGSAELSEMRRQTADYAEARRAAGLPMRYVEIPGANHYTILNSMMDRDGQIHRSIVAMLGARPSAAR